MILRKLPLMLGLAAILSLISTTVLVQRGIDTANPTPPCNEGLCESRPVWALDILSKPTRVGTAQESEHRNATVEEMLEKGLALAESSPVNLVVRGTPE